MDKDSSKGRGKGIWELGEGNEEKDTKDKEQYRVVINKKANEVLEEIVENANEGFDAGMITKSDLAVYVFLNLRKFITEADIRNLRILHFDDRKVLSSLLKSSEDSNGLPDELKRALREHFGVSEKDKKRGPKLPSQAA